MRNRSPSKLFYTVSELASMSGCSRWRMRALLENNGVSMNQQGARRGGVVFVSTLVSALPDLVDSIKGYGQDE